MHSFFTAMCRASTFFMVASRTSTEGLGAPHGDLFDVPQGPFTQRADLGPARQLFEVFEDDVHGTDHKRDGCHDVSVVEPAGGHGALGRRLLGLEQALCRPTGWSIRSLGSAEAPHVTEMVARAPSGLQLRTPASESRSRRTSVDPRSPEVRTMRPARAETTALR